MRPILRTILSPSTQLCIRIFQRVFADMATDISDMRKPYHNQENIFDLQHLAALEPFGQFKHWFDDACKQDSILEPNAMSLATATKDGRPSVRMVLMKSFDKNGIAFCTNYESRKAKELEENPFCCLMFYWEPLKRCVRIEGKAERVLEEESEKYFQSRPLANQIGALVSQQSRVIPSREMLDKKNDELTAHYTGENKPVPRPEYWGGYLIVPEVFEFWQGQTNRLHDRLRFRRQNEFEIINPELTKMTDDGWLLERLAP